MKRYFIYLFFGISFGSCSIPESKQQINIKADNVLMTVFETGDITLLDGIIDPDFVNHTGGGQVGLDNLKNMVKSFHSNNLNLKMEVITQMLNDDYVVDWVQFTGSNPSISIEGMEVTRYTDGLAREHWFFPKNQNSGN
ncbi:MAG: hypothetical protein CL868_16780 [Cytophagaceae bacterium]|nr:hypothetical protein [Cytophagaceae bacterium]